MSHKACNDRPAAFTIAGSSALHLDPKLTWLAPGAPPHSRDPASILAATQPWFQYHPSRQAFLTRVLALLISGPFASYQPLCEALLAVEASHVTPDAASAETDQQPGDDSASGQLNVNRAREAAKKLLTKQRGNLGMWAAYAGLESQAGQYKVTAPSKHHSATMNSSHTSLKVHAAKRCILLNKALAGSQVQTSFLTALPMMPFLERSVLLP